MEANKAFSQDAEKILKLQEKLSFIQNQIHFWSAKSKVFEQKENSNNFEFWRTLFSNYSQF